MRDIKFRAWDKTDGKMLDHVLAGCNMAGESYVCHQVWSTEFRAWVNFDEACGALMQFTGLRDKNGKEIYEGDIVSFCVFDHNGSDTQYTGVVTWANASFEIWHDVESEFYGSDGGFSLAWVCSQDEEFEVIGHIHEGVPSRG